MLHEQAEFLPAILLVVAGIVLVALWAMIESVVHHAVVRHEHKMQENFEKETQ